MRLTAILATSALLLGGCATPQKVAVQATESAQAIEQAHNKMLLLNIVRAFHKYPMHFARINTIQGPQGTGVPSFTVPLPFGPDFSSQVYTPSVTYKPDSPSFTLQAIDAQEFMQGVTKPLSLKTLAFYLEQGWPQQMLLYLFVREIEVHAKEGEDTVLRQRFVNDPLNKELFDEFSKKLKEMINCEFVFRETVSEIDIGPELTIDDKYPVEKLVAVHNANLLLKSASKDPKKFQLKSVVKLPALKVQERYPKDQVKKNDQLGCALLDSASKNSKSKNGATNQTILSFGAKELSSDRLPGESDAGRAAKPEASLTLRSVEGAIYYLGELARRQHVGTVENSVVNSEKDGIVWITQAAHGTFEVAEKLFDLRHGADGQAVVEVNYDDTRYYIGKNSGLSTRVLSLLTQLLALQSKSVDPPLTGTVRLSTN